MGIFQKLVKCYNRAPVELTVTFDGQRLKVPPGEFECPAIAIDYGKNQNPIMGSADPYNPHISGGKYLIGIVGEDDCEPLTQEEWEEHLRRPCREDERVWFADRYGSDPRAKQVLMGKGRKTTASSRYEAGAGPQGISSFGGKD